MIIKPTIICGLLAELELPDLVREASAVIEGQVKASNESTSISMLGGPSGIEMIWTDHVVRVQNTLKDFSPSLAGETITIRTMGGLYQEQSIRVDGEAQLRSDEDVILFLSQDSLSEKTLPALVFTIYGGFQGKFTVTTDANERVVSRIDQIDRKYQLEQFRKQVSNNLEPPALAAGSAV